jgi:hypothetical protein
LMQHGTVLRGRPAASFCWLMTYQRPTTFSTDRTVDAPYVDVAAQSGR